MRTLSSTFSTRSQAEAAIERLEAIGIARERIILKEVAQTGAEPAAAGATGAAFLSVKVTTDQVQPASDILKGQWTVDDAARPALKRLGEEPAAPTAPAATAPPSPPRPLPAAEATFGYSPPREEAPPQHRPRRGQRPGEERARLGRYFVYYGLALVAAFMVGAWLGLLS